MLLIVWMGVYVIMYNLLELVWIHYLRERGRTIYMQ